MKNLKREIPNKGKLRNRTKILTTLLHTSPKRDLNCLTPPLFEPGNSKTGYQGKVFQSIRIWNLPAIVTCPGYSKWCLDHCYNGDDRVEKFPLEKWRNNWWWSLNKPDELKLSLINQLLTSKNPVGVRLHSSGDFFSSEYIKFWIDIVSTCSNVNFWAYTRSWCVPKLSNWINKLSQIKNINLFYSVDKDMPPLPTDRKGKSIIFENVEEMKKYKIEHDKAFICPEQLQSVDGCCNCGLCASKKGWDVLFLLH